MYVEVKNVLNHCYRGIAQDLDEILYAFLILTILYYGNSNGHMNYELQILSYT
jgi:hypothetical protein